jgi:TRAP-type C4-dicarboxylate transport system substrate-binding protein
VKLVALLTLCALSAPALAQRTLRFGSAVPEGTAWAREGQAFAREVATGTNGAVKVRWYLGGIAGDERTMGDRMRRDQLDGMGSGGMLCGQLAPSMRVLRSLGLFQSRDESSYVMGRLKPIFDEEFQKSGYTNLWNAGLGPDVLFSRVPVRSLDELRKLKVWVWDLDDMLKEELAQLGVPSVPLPLEQAARAWDDGKIDGFVAIPTAALAFQWSSQAKFISDVRMAFLPGCLIITNRAFDSLSHEQQQVMQAAAAKFRVRMEELGRTTDDALLGGLFARQGLKSVPVTQAFRAEFFAAVRAARTRLADRLVPRPLYDRVIELLADFRAEREAR